MSQPPPSPQKRGDSNSNPASDDTAQPEMEIKRPEFVLIDDRNGKTSYTYFDADAKPTSHETRQSEEPGPQGKKTGISLRFACFLGLLFCLIFGVGILFLSIILTLLAVFSLFMNKELNADLINYWKLFFSTLTSAICFSIGMVIPPLGLFLLGIFFAYASKDSALSRFIKKNF